MIEVRSEGARVSFYEFNFYPLTMLHAVHVLGGMIWMGIAIQRASAGAATAGIAADAYSMADSQGGSQVMVTTMLLDGNRMVMSKTDSYFIADVDLSQYVSTAPAADVARPMKAGATPPPTRSFAVISE